MKRPDVLPLAAMLAGIALVGFSTIAHPQPRLVWNASASAPIGLYRVIYSIMCNIIICCGVD